MTVPEKLLVAFVGTDGPVDLTGCPQVYELLPELFKNWPFERVKVGNNPNNPVLKIQKSDNRYHLSSPLNDKSQSLKDPLNTACSLVAELAWARLRKQPDLLCFHGAAVEFGDQLVLFPNRRRAGKSTLTACLAARGHRVFTDDYLPLALDRQSGLDGIANGAAPRLRLPVPDEFSPSLKTFLKEHAGPANAQYLYLNLVGNLLAQHGERRPVSTIILLDRVDNAKPSLNDETELNILKRLIKQNFSRSMNPARILELLGCLTANSRLKTLRYSNAEEAAEILDQNFQVLSSPHTVGPIALPKSSRLKDIQADLHPTPEQFCADGRYRQADCVAEIAFQQESILASTRGARIHHVNATAKAIWSMLETPATTADLVRLFRDAFPDEPAAKLTKDLEQSIAEFARQGLLERVNDEPQNSLAAE
ncbi:MAG: PqqD family peptide modification chaperone [Rhodobacteraceae bacterium]|nr:PqqD family peptide modification chaperone [Paracoccaceae bacterium]